MSSENDIAVDQHSGSGSDSDNSGYQTRSEYSTASLTSSVYEYRFENGRRYHAYKDGQYAFPNDEKEQDRLDIMHHIYSLLLENELHLAPIGTNPQKILDVGTGTGIWAIDIAECYPSAEVTGIDLSPIQPSWVPPNVKFQIDDAEAEWTWQRDSFDYIHMRHLAGAIKDWPALLKQAYKCLKPGGYVEIQEYHMGLFSDDGSYNENTYIWKFYHLVGKAAEKNGRLFEVVENIEPLLKDAGFHDINMKMIKAPMGTWAADRKQKERGAYLQMACESGFEAIGMALLTRDMKMDPEEAKLLIDSARADIGNRKIHSYSKHYFGYGQKPLKHRDHHGHGHEHK